MSTTLEERVALLERGQRRWRGLTFAALVLAGASLAVLVTEGTGHRKLRASSLSIIDSSGRVVATLAAENGGPLLRMHSEETGASLLLGALPDDLGLAISDATRPRVYLAFGKDGFPALSMSDKAGRTRLLAGLDKETSGESPFLQLRDASGRVRIYALVTTKAHFLVRDEAGKPSLDVPAGLGDEHVGAERRR